MAGGAAACTTFVSMLRFLLRWSFVAALLVMAAPAAKAQAGVGKEQQEKIQRKKEKEERKAKARKVKEDRKRHLANQDKATRKRIKKNQKRADRSGKGAPRDPFPARLFKPKH